MIPGSDQLLRLCVRLSLYARDVLTPGGGERVWRSSDCGYEPKLPARTKPLCDDVLQ